MGLRHRTPMGALREQRKAAERMKAKTDRRAVPHAANLKGQVRFRELAADKTAALVFAEGLEPARSLLHRLRQAIQPDLRDRHDEPLLQREYSCLQAELLRLTEREHAVRVQARTGYDKMDLQSPLNGDGPMIRIIQISIPDPQSSASTQGQSITPLASLPSGLDSYRIHVSETKKTALPLQKRGLSLVPQCSQEDPSNGSCDTDAMAQLAAKLTARALQATRRAKQPASITEDITLALLDS